VRLSDLSWNIVRFCAPVWHYALTEAQTQQLEAIKKRAIQIILNFSREMTYSSMLFLLARDS